MPEARLEARDVTAGYSTPVVTGIGLAVRAGEITSVVGPNGSGKSTLLKAITGTIPIMSGSVHLAGHDVTGRTADEIARRGLGYVPQVDDVFPPLTVTENLEVGGYLLPSRALRARVEAVLETFPRLATMRGRLAGRLSGGERKMLAIGRALMTEPAVLVLDEPTANLAPAAGRTLLEDHVRGLAAGGTAVLIVEQRARAVLAISDWTCVLGGGRLRLSGPPADLRADPDFSRTYLGAPGRTSP